ncbi:acyltransferase family protein [Paenibacillus guangzhouensis]|uniref:acyltransferase family protein n=1 Tax=Paenibacillus guangzhouensis TaxID=1473112 RepID=UPI0012671F51|nr:acyltransferase [Paenibacillus guangzhouensis]
MTSKITYLDGLRGLAACIVVVSHFFQVFAPSVFEGKADIAHFAFESFAARTPINLLFNGNFSVCLFFVLSGYVLSYRYFRTKDPLPVYSSALRRYLRLAVPAVLSVVIAYLVICFGFGYYDDIQGMTLSSMPDPFTASASFSVMIQEAFYHTFFTYGMTYNPVLWTMTYELFGSFLIFGFLLLVGKFKLRFLIYLALCWVFIDSYYLGFVLGMLLSDLRYSDRERNWLDTIRRPWVNVLLLIAGLYLGSFPYLAVDGTVYALLVWQTGASFAYFQFYHVIGAFMVLLALLNSSRMQAWFSSKPFAYLGKISFSLYLVHFTLLCSFGSYLFLHLHDILPYGVSVVLTVLITTPVIFMCAHFYYRWVDAVTLAVLARWSKRLLQPMADRNKQRLRKGAEE